MSEEKLYTVTGDSDAPTNLRVQDSVGPITLRSDGLLETNVIWWIGLAANDKDALQKCKENIRQNHCQYVECLDDE